MLFLFPFWGHFPYCGSPFFPFFNLACESHLTAGKGLWGLFFFCLPSSTTGKYEADPVYVCSNLKRSWYAVVIKEESRTVYPAEEYQSSKSESPPGPSSREQRALCCSPKVAPKSKAKISATAFAPCTPGTDAASELCLYKKSKALFLCMNVFFEICLPETFCALKYNLNA